MESPKHLALGVVQKKLILKERATTGGCPYNSNLFVGAIPLWLPNLWIFCPVLKWHTEKMESPKHLALGVVQKN